ncbi:MAG: phosphoenolpyruvate carboxykinase (ATP) [Ferruginibacter sp.]
MKENNVKVWLINTGWSGGPYGIGKRMKLGYTRAMITAALEGLLDNVEYETTPWFKLSIPKTCPNVPSEILNARNTWPTPEAFDKKAQALAIEFVKNLKNTPVALMKKF